MSGNIFMKEIFWRRTAMVLFAVPLVIAWAVVGIWQGALLFLDEWEFPNRE